MSGDVRYAFLAVKRKFPYRATVVLEDFDGAPAWKRRWILVQTVPGGGVKIEG
jgi:hypothetical protein